MNLTSHKKIILIIISVLIVGSGIILANTDWFDFLKKRPGIIFDLKIKDKQIPVEKSRYASREECLKTVDDMSDEELIEEFEQAGAGSQRRLMVEYLACRVKYRKNEELYNMAREYANKYVSKKRMGAVLVGLEEAYNSFVQFDYIRVRALETDNSICLDGKLKPEILDLCLKRRKQEIDNFSGEKAIGRCNQVCNTIDKYSNNLLGYEELLKNISWPEEKSQFIDAMYRRIELAFRFGGAEFALKICGQILDLKKDEKELCETHVYNLSYLKSCIETHDCRNVPECVGFRQNVIKIICDVDVNQ